MKLHNTKTGVAFNTRTTKELGCFKSIVERWECDANGIPTRAYASSIEKHATRSQARHYAESMARYQFRKHCSIFGM